MDTVMVMDLNAAGVLIDRLTDTKLSGELGDAMWYAEEGDVCNDVFIFNYVDEFVVAAEAQGVEFILR